MNVAFATLHWYFSLVNGNFINIKPISPLYSWERKILIFGAVNSWTLDENVCLGLAHFTTWQPKSKHNVYLLLWCQFPCFKWKRDDYITLYCIHKISGTWGITTPFGTQNLTLWSLKQCTIQLILFSFSINFFWGKCLSAWKWIANSHQTICLRVHCSWSLE